jgi:hypothetical protein
MVPTCERDPINIGVKGRRAGMGSRVELFASIRRDARVEGASIRELARGHHVARKMVGKALESPLAMPSSMNLALRPETTNSLGQKPAQGNS